MRQVYGIWMYMDVYGIITCTWNASLLFCNCCVVFFRLIQFKPACVQGARHTCHDGVLCSVLPLGPGWARSTKNSAYFNIFQPFCGLNSQPSFSAGLEAEPPALTILRSVPFGIPAVFAHERTLQRFILSEAGQCIQPLSQPICDHRGNCWNYITTLKYFE